MECTIYSPSFGRFERILWLFLAKEKFFSVQNGADLGGHFRPGAYDPGHYR